MAETNILADGNASWVGGMDTSRPPQNIGELQYSKGCNVIVGDSLTGLVHRPGYSCCQLVFSDSESKRLFSEGAVLDCQYFISDDVYLVAYVNGIAFRFTPMSGNQFYVEGININSPNAITTLAWATRVRDMVIINNNINTPIVVTASSGRRTEPENGEIGIGQAAAFVQNRLFYIDQSGKRLIASDFNQPLRETESAIYGNIGFAAPDADEVITAVSRQKTMLTYIEGGNLVFSTNKDLYSVDVRGARSTWSDLGVPLGKVRETIPGYSASSSYSFTEFNSNIYFRNAKYGISNLRQSEFQYTQLDVSSNQALEASYYLDNDTDWMLDRCRMVAFNRRLLTTVSPKQDENGFIYWKGILSFCPAFVAQENQRAPQRYESVWTGVDPWCMVSVSRDNKKDILYVFARDPDGKNRLYKMDGSLDYDQNQFGQKIEIKGFVETKAYTFQNPLAFKKTLNRFLKIQPVERTIQFEVFARPEVNGPWTSFYDVTYNICRSITKNGVFTPENTHASGKTFVLGSERFNPCYPGTSFNYIQYRIEFTGPIKIDWFALSANLDSPTQTITSTNEECVTLIYNYRPDYGYYIFGSYDKPTSSITTGE